MVKTSNFDYELPRHMIAQKPVEPRDASKLMVINTSSESIEHKIFKDIIQYLNPGDVLVLNNTRVIPARLFLRKRTGARVEIFLLERKGDFWNCLVKPGRKFLPGDEAFLNGKIVASCVERCSDGSRLVRFNVPDAEVIKYGKIPLPPYIKSKGDNFEKRYQTVYASEDGAVAAPTAGLHFTDCLLETIRDMGVRIVELTLHVGIGTFRPVKTEDLEKHRLHAEKYFIPEETISTIEAAKEKGHKIVAVGTTVVRALEAYASTGEKFGNTDIFIYPPYEFKIVDSLITNFHLPRSTLLMLVCAFAGYDLTIRAYRIAVEKNYRFYSFGDAMLILRG